MRKNAALYATLLSALLFLSACGNSSTSTEPLSQPLPAQVRAQSGTTTIAGFYPAWQVVGSAITISGTGFDTVASNNVVTFSNKIQAQVASATATSLVVIVPSGIQNGQIKVATSGGTATSAAPFVEISTANPPTISSSPTSGTLGSSVTISGTDFSTTTANNIVKFNGTPATVSAATATSLTVVVPDATNGNLTVTTPSGTAVSSHTFSITPIPGTDPTISSFTPLRGLSGTMVTISGTNFDATPANNVVKFNGIPATVSTATATTLVVTVPAGVSTGPIAVTAPVTTSGVTTLITAKSAAMFSVTDNGVAVAGLRGGAIQGTPLALKGTALTFAGGGVVNSSADGDGTVAKFNNPNGMVSDGTNIYIADTGNRVIRRLEISTNKITTLAGSGLAGSDDGTGAGASFSSPVGITTDGVSLFVTDAGNNRVRQITPLTGTLAAMTSGNAAVTTLAGSGSLTPTSGTSGTWDGTGTLATIRSPYGITIDGTNTNLYLADGSNRIRQINILSKSVTTLAGSGAFSSIDGTGIAASFYRPHAITRIGIDLYVTDSGTNVIRKVVISSGVVTTLVGPGFTEGIILKSFQNPNGLSTDGTDLYVADSSNNRILKVVISSSAVSTVAGTGIVGSLDDATGINATFRLPNGIAMSGFNLYVSDSGNNLIRKIVITPTATVTTVAGSVVVPSLIDGIGTSSKFNFPYGITTDGTNLYVADSGENLIRKIAISSGVVTMLAGSGVFGAVDARGTSARVNYPFGITTDGKNLYVADTDNNTIRQIVLPAGDAATAGDVRILAGSGFYGSADGVGTAASFSHPAGITTDGVNLYVADTDNHKIRKIEISTGVVTTFAGSGVTGSTDAVGTAASFQNPVGITMDATKLYIADAGNNKIRQIDIATGSVNTLAGTGDYWYDDVYTTVGTTIEWPGLSANFRSPAGITTDGTYLYVTDSDNNEIRRIEISTGKVLTMAGSGAFGSMDGTGTEASFSQPVGITTDGKNLYTTEYLNNLIRKIQ